MRNSRKNYLIDKAKRMLKEANKDNFDRDVPNSGELYIFDFDETLAYTPEAEWKLFFGHYTDGFQAASPEESMQAIEIIVAAGITPSDIKSSEGTTWVTLDYKNYEKARGILSKPWRKQNFKHLPTKLKLGSYQQREMPMSIFFVFPDNIQKAPENYKVLPCLDILKSKLLAGVPCYICTARSGQEEANNILDFLRFHNISLPVSKIHAVGSENKGITVNMLINQYSPSSVYFYDDSKKNCENVFEMCCNSVEELHIFQLSRAIPGDVIHEKICGTLYNECYTRNHRLIESQLFRRMRKLSGY